MNIPILRITQIRTLHGNSVAFYRQPAIPAGSTIFAEKAHLLCRLLVLLFLIQSAIRAQYVTGNLQLIIVDTLAESIPAVNVVVTGQNLQGLRGSVSDNLGHCTILALPPGKVSIHLSHTAYQSVVIEGVDIEMGKTTFAGEVRLREKILGMPELVISGQRPVIDPRTTAYGSNLHSTDYQDLPVERNYRSTVALLPQANTSYYGDEANISGATGNENKYSVDGVEVTDPFTASTGTTLPYNFIQEIVVTPGGYDADTRSALGGLINVITFSGTNELHGSVFGFYTGNHFVGSHDLGLLDPTQGDFTNYDVGVGIGGPIVRDQLWFFSAYNPTFARRDVAVPGFGTSVDKTVTHSFAAKLSWKPEQQLQVVLTATGDPTKQNGVGRNVLVPPSDLTNPDSYFTDVEYGGINVSLSGTWMAAPNLMLEASVARVAAQAVGEPATQRGADEVFFGDYTTNVWTGGVQTRWNAPRVSIMSSLSGTFLYGAHSFKTGMDYKDNSVDNQYSYHSISKYGNTSYYESMGEGYGVVHHRIPSLFLQDAWQVTHALNIHGGIRFDDQFMIGSNGSVAQKVTIPLQPRFGFVYMLDEEGSQKVYGSYGRYAQELTLMLSVDYHSEGGYNYVIFYNHDPRLSSTGGTKVYDNLHSIKSEVPGLRGQFFDEYSIGYEHSVGANIRLSVQGLYKTLGEAVDNVFLTSENRYQFGNPGSGILSDWPRPSRYYTALIVTVQRHEDENFNFLASYVLSRDYGNYEGLFDALSHNGFPNQNVTFNDLNTARVNATGLVPNDRTHVFKFAGSYRFLFGVTAGISFIAESGTPLSEYAYSDFGIRFLSPRGSNGRTPSLWDLNARLMYQLPIPGFSRVRLIVDVFHIASQRKPVDLDQAQYKYADPDGNVRTPNLTYGMAYRYQPPMSARVGVEIGF